MTFPGAHDPWPMTLFTEATEEKDRAAWSPRSAHGEALVHGIFIFVYLFFLHVFPFFPMFLHFFFYIVFFVFSIFFFSCVFSFFFHFFNFFPFFKFTFIFFYFFHFFKISREIHKIHANNWNIHMEHWEDVGLELCVKLVMLADCSTL